jgi:hypothetical protein
MASPAPRWPNVERGVVRWLGARTGRPVYTESDEELEERLPAYRVERVGGADAYELGKEIQVEVSSLAATRPELWAAVADAESAMEALKANGFEGFYVDDVRETFSAAVVPYRNDGVRKATATYGLTLRPQ